jgi:hypothetical protein
MTKRELIDAIVAINPTAMPEFLARFSDLALREYYEHLSAARQPRLAGDADRYEQYFDEPPARTSPVSEALAIEQVADDLEETDEELTAILAERASKRAFHLLDEEPQPEEQPPLVGPEDLEDPEPVKANMTLTDDPYPLELDDLGAEDPMADIGLSPRNRREAQPADEAQPAGVATGPSHIEELKQDRQLLF